MSPNSSRARSLLIFLWISVFVWGIAFGGKLFELLILISAWAADPPTSLSLLPYGPRWPFDPGDFFQPLMLLGLIGSVGALVSGRNAPRTYKMWLWAPLIILIIIGFTLPTIFWPMIRDLYGASTGVRPLTDAASQSLANRWIVFDCGREALIGMGFISAIRAISTTHRANGD